MSSAAIVFLDRDGTINVDDGYVCKPNQLRLIDGAAESLAKLKKAGFVLIVVSNQSGIARGFGTEKDVEATNIELERQLKEAHPDAVLDCIVYCPHHPDQGCSCRKPKTGLVEQFTERWQVDPAKCWMLGDKESDLDFAGNLGVPAERQILLLTGHGNRSLERLGAGRQEDGSLQVRADINEAVEYILEQDL